MFLGIRKTITFAAFCFLSSSLCLAQLRGPVALDPCHGTRLEMKVLNGMPYVSVKVEGATGYFVLDWGTLSSVVDAKGLLGPSYVLKPPVNTHPSTENGLWSSFSGLEFFGGGWNPFDARNQDFSAIFLQDENGTVQKQVGIMEADFISHAFFTIDYANGAVYRSITVPYCSDTELKKEGFRPVSTAGYFADKDERLNDKCVYNVPTVPVRIAGIMGVAQVDSGFNDKGKHSVIVNPAMLKALQDASIEMNQTGPVENLTTCVGSTETITPYTMKMGTRFEVVGTSGQPVISQLDFHLYVKNTPEDAKACGGIGLWKIPAAQIGSSYLSDSGQTVYDPMTSRIWLGRFK